MGIKLKVSGVNILLNDLDKYSNDIQKKVGDEIQQWGKNTVEAAKRDVPVDTGALKSSIRDVIGSDRKSVVVKAGGINNVDYAPYIEWGTGAFVDQNFLQEFGLVQYASQFKGAGVKQVNLPARTFLYRNARTELEKTFAEIKKIIESSWK